MTGARSPLSAGPQGSATAGEKPLGPLARYRRVLAALRRERGERCECCGVPTRAAHHVLPVSASGICAPLVYEPANLLLLCDDCHALMHPGYRAYAWFSAAVRRGRTLTRSR